MGLVKAALGAASGVMGDQWKEYFYCSALPAEVLAVKGQKKVSGRSSNRHGAENIITDGSIVAVAEGQCALIVEQGKVVDLCAEAGEYTYKMCIRDRVTKSTPSSACRRTTSMKSCAVRVARSRW